MFVSTRSPTLLALLLLMATLPYLLPTKQSSLVPSLGRHQIWLPSIKALNFTTANRGLLRDEPAPIPSEAQRCINVSNANPNALTAANQCHAYQVSWLDLLEQKGVHTDDNEYKCKKMYCNSYCDNLVARKYCLPDQYASLHSLLQQQFDAKAQGDCIKWTSWQPRLDAPPPAITCENIECQDALIMNEAGDTCVKEVIDKIGTEGKNITDRTELLCKTIYWGEKCAIRQVCKYCTKSANAYLNFVHSIWSPAKVECTNWTAAEEPKMQCPTQSSNGSCQSVLTEKGVPEQCTNETRVKYPEWDPLNPGMSIEMQCRAAFYSFDCGMKAACEQCKDPKDYVEQARKDMDSNEAVCKPWSSEAPKLQCPSNILLIVGIIIGALLLAICLVICYMCFTSSDKSERRSSSKGSRRSKPKGNTPRSRNKAGSSMGAKQASRAATAGTKKMSSRASGGGGRPVKKQSRLSKGAKPQSRVKQSKRSRASALK